jgi:hypothetical protein
MRNLFIFRYLMMPLLTIISFPLIGGCQMYLPPIEGRVVDAISKEPISGATVLCFNYRCPLSQAVNVGGANREPVSIDIAQTGTDGRFHIPSYLQFSLARDDIRFFMIYKRDYSVVMYNQADSTHYMNLNKFPESPLEPVNTEFQLDRGYERVGSLVTTLDWFSIRFMFDDPEKLSKYKPIFIWGYTEVSQLLPQLNQSLPQHQMRLIQMSLRSLGTHLPKTTDGSER